MQYWRICDITESRNLLLLLEEAHYIVANDLVQHGNRKSMISSLKTVLNEIDTVKKHVVFVENHEKYKMINGAYNLSKNHKGGLLYDEVWQAVALHYMQREWA